MGDFRAALLAVDISSNYVEYGDTVYVTTKWQNAGDGYCTQNVKIAVDFEFDMQQRHLENLGDGFRLTWTPAPEVCEWRPGSIWSTTGAWKVPQTWCGYFHMSVSLLGENGESLPFVGKDGREVFRQEIADVDLGWGWGRIMLEATRHPVHVDVGQSIAADSMPETTAGIPLGMFICDPAYPAVIGAGEWRWTAEAPVVTVRDRETNTVIRCLKEEQRPVFTLKEQTEHSLDYSVEGMFGSGVVRFVLDNGLKISLEDVQEKGNYELLSIELPDILRVGDRATLVNFFCGGREITVKDALPMRAEFPYDVCNAMAAYDAAQTVAVLTDDMEMLLYQSVVQREKKKQGRIGAKLVHRVRADKPGLPSIPFAGRPLELVVLEGGSWQPFARLMRSRLPEGRGGLYDNTLFYKIGVDMVMQGNPNRPETLSKPIRLDAVKEIIRGMYNMTNGMRQVVYLVGWQENGHDTMYPNPHRHAFSPRVGTDEEWEEVRRFAKQHNTILSFHDNFDDAYLADDLDMSLLAMDERGGNKRGWLWAGGMTYMLSLQKYIESGEMEERVKDSYHLDVLTSEVRRYDFTPGRQSAAWDNVQRKRDIVSCFNRYGVDVTSESLAMPFVGSIGYALHTRYNFDEVLFPGETILPLTTMMYHGIVPYNMGSGEIDGLLRAVAFGANCGLDRVESLDASRLTRSVYLHAMPMQLLSGKRVLSCEVTPQGMSLQYENNGRVTVDFTEKRYEIIADGVRIGWDFHTVLPSFDGRGMLAYSLEGSQLEVPVPDNWDTATIYRLSFGDKERLQQVKTTGGCVILDASPETPYLIQED